MTDGIRRFSEFAKEGALEGDKMSIADVFNKEIIVTAYRISDSKCVHGKKCLQLQFKFDGKLKVLFSSSSVLIKQCESYSDQMPFCAVIKKVGQYHTFT